MVLGRLASIADSATGTRRFLYDGDALVAEYASYGTTVLRRYVHGPGTDNPVAWYEGATVSASSRRQLFADARGSIVLVTNATGTTLAINAYDDWGIAEPGNAGAFQYTGQIWLPELGLYYYKARMYSPTLGRFMQTDPIGYEDGMNIYAYVGNDPVNAVDPTGLGIGCSEDEDGNVHCTDDGHEEIKVEGERNDRPSMRKQAETTLSLPRDPDGGAGANAAAAIVVFGSTFSELRDLGASVVGAAAAAAGFSSERVVTPDQDPTRFEKLPGKQGFKDKETGMVFQPDRGNRSGGAEAGGAHGDSQWKVKNRSGKIVASVFSDGRVRRGAGALPKRSFSNRRRK